jgi:hypothetical protein
LREELVGGCFYQNSAAIFCGEHLFVTRFQAIVTHRFADRKKPSSEGALRG